MFQGNFRGGYGRGQSFGHNSLHTFQAPKATSSFTRSGFVGVNGPQESASNIEELTCQICFKTGHTTDICWHRFI